ncbi:MAG: hypothetical protein KDI13_06450 [Alphaproteobacteria bacterium]|nr:hypothetical protein [Alphaproteobacteria bacterium]
MTENLDNSEQNAERSDDNPSSDASPPPRAQETTGGNGKFITMDNIQIYPDRPLPRYDNGPVKAYAASDPKGKDKEGYVALICEPELVPRRKIAPFYRETGNTTLLRLNKTDICYWNQTREQRFVFVYHDLCEQPLLTGNIAPPDISFKNSFMTELVIRPIVSALRELADKNMFHGNIRPSNIYYAKAGRDQPVILGDGLSLPPGFSQPILFETIQRSHADPVAKGPGSISEDLYALGVTLATMMYPNPKLEGMRDEEIIRKKVELGSYAALTEGERISSSHVELLRGLLHDDHELRWGMEDIMGWLDGRRLTPQQPKKKKQAMRTLKFADRKYISAYPLALDFHKYKEEAVMVFEDGKLQEWLERSVDDKEAVERLEIAQSSINSYDSSSPAQKREYLVSMVKTALAPDLPLHYKSLDMMSEGIGYALAKTFILKHDLRPFHELFDNKLPISQLYMQEQAHILPPKMFKTFEQCRQAVRQSRVSEGLERCLYMLCPDVQCLSPRLEGFYIRNAGDLLIAFETLCSKGQAPENFIDRHVAAFLSVRDSQLIDSYIFDLNTSEKHRLIFAALKILAASQKRFRLPPLPNVAKTLAERLAPVYERFHDRHMRNDIDTKVQKAARDGDLNGMLSALDNAEMKNKDFHSFRNAMIEYKNLSNEHKQLTNGLQHKATFGRVRGHNISVIVSAILATILVVLVILARWSGNSFI